MSKTNFRSNLRTLAKIKNSFGNFPSVDKDESTYCSYYNLSEL